MKINFTITNGTVELLSNTDTGANTLIINGTEIPSTDWTGSGYYTYDGISIQKIADNTGNIYCNKITATSYVLNREVPVSGGGHVILDESGVSMPQRAKLQFENCTVTDDSTNDKTIVTAEEGMGFVLANRTLTFSNNIATVSDSRVTANTYATVYFHDGSLAAAVNAGLSVDTSTGTITITAESTPSASLTCDIVCESGTGGGSISHQIAELRDDVDALDALIGDTDISSIGNGTATGAISTLNSNLTTKISVPTGQGKNYTSVFVCTGVQLDSGRICCMLPFPFCFSSNNYTLSFIGASLIGVADVTADKISADSKYTTGARIMLARSGTVGSTFAVQIGITITY